MDGMPMTPDGFTGAKTCVTTGNASLSLCNVDEKGDNPVNKAPMSAEAHKRAEKEAEEKAKTDYSSFDIVKATQYGALERVVELVDEKSKKIKDIDIMEFFEGIGNLNFCIKLRF